MLCRPPVAALAALIAVCAVATPLAAQEARPAPPTVQAPSLPSLPALPTPDRVARRLSDLDTARPDRPEVRAETEAARAARTADVEAARARAARVVAPAWYAASAGGPAAITVNTLDGDNDGSCDSGGTGPTDDCSLLEALDLANSTPLTADVVAFSVSGTIAPVSTPTVTTPVTIDGTLNGRSAGDVKIDAPDGGFMASLRVSGAGAAGSVVRGLGLVGASGLAQNGVEILDTEGVELYGNYIGTDAAGADLTDGDYGVYVVGSSGTVVGSHTAPNTIGHHTIAGVVLSDSEGTAILGNRIGSDGTNAFGNGFDGVEVIGSSGTVVGSAAAPNTIGHHTGAGVYVWSNSEGTEILGNLIGSDGTNVFGNGLYGVRVEGSSGTVVGSAAAPNTIGHHTGAGVYVWSNSEGTEILGNLIGSDGTNVFGNGNYGVWVSGSSGTVVGSAEAPNTIGNHTVVGVDVSSGSEGTAILGNLIGSDGTNVFGNGAYGVRVSGPSGTVVGSAAAPNTIGNHTTAGVLVVFASDTEILGNLIGSDGTNVFGNGRYGVQVFGASGTVVGSAAAPNTIGNHTQAGVYVEFGSEGTAILGNLIGSDGTNAFGNGAYGVRVSGSSGTAVGSAAAPNTIGHHTDNGVFVESGSESTAILGNLIGSDGTNAFGNGSYGVRVSGSSGTAVGSAAAPNTIGHHTDNGVFVRAGSEGTEILGNHIGADGTNVFGNGFYGVRVLGSSGTVVGSAAAPNTIGNHTLAGVYVLSGSEGTEVLGNRIGSDGTNAFGNGSYGVYVVGSSGTVVGSAAAPNTIGNHTGAGVFVFSGSEGTAILGNSITDNGGLGIDLSGGGSPDGVTPNDAPDADGFQNFPVITDATLDAVAFTLDTRPGRYRVEAFASAAPDPSGHGEGARFLGATTVTADGAGSAAGSIEGLAAAPGEWVALTATPFDAGSPSGGTSEFSLAVGAAVPVSFAVAQQGASEGVGSVDLVVEVEASPSDPATVTVTLASGDPADLGGFGSASFVVGGPGDVGDGGRYTVAVPVTDDAFAEDTETFLFELSVENTPGAATPLRADGDPTALVVTDNDGEAVTVTVEAAPGPFLFASPVSGLRLADLRAELGTDAEVFVYDPATNAFVPVSDGRVFGRGEAVLVVSAGGPLALTGTLGGDVVSYAVDAGDPALVVVGNPTGAPVALGDVVVTGGALADIALVFDGGAFRPVSLGGLAGPDAQTAGDAALTLGAFGVVVLGVTPEVVDGVAATVTVTLDTSADAATGPPIADAPFVPADGETAVLLALASDSGERSDTIALRFGVGTAALDAFDGLDVTTPTGPTLAAFGWTGGETMDDLFAALSGDDLESGPVTVPLVVAVPQAGTYTLSLASPGGEVGPRPVVVEVFDGTSGTVVDGETAVSFTVGAGEDLTGRFTVRISLGAAVATEVGPGAFALAAFPNPSSDRVTLSVTAPDAGPVRVAVYDVLGREVAVPHDGPVAAGGVRVELSVAGLAPGAYVVRAEGVGVVAVQRLTVTR